MGKLTIIGAGQKHDLITVRGLNALKKAEVVLYDRLIDEKLLSETDCEKIDVGKLPYCHKMKQDYINDLIREKLTVKKHVVRLKGGDSVLFARVSEEVEIARELNCEVDIIPGVTTASSAVAKLGCGLTDRRNSAGLVIITGHKKEDTLAEDYDWASLAKGHLTITVYMTVKNMPLISRLLLENGMDKSTPCLIAEKVETDEERLITAELSNLVRTVEEKNISHPALLIIGQVLGGSGE